jgi:hypothetical protein
MKMAVTERILLMSMLPVTGDIQTLKMLRELRESLSFSEEEGKEINVRVEQDEDQIRTMWDGSKAAAMEPKEIEVNGVMKALVVKILQEMANADPPTLEDKHIELWDLFCG